MEVYVSEYCGVVDKCFLPLASHFSLFFWKQNHSLSLVSPEPQHKSSSYSAEHYLYELGFLTVQNDPTNSILTGKKQCKEKKLICTFKHLFYVHVYLLGRIL